METAALIELSLDDWRDYLLAVVTAIPVIAASLGLVAIVRQFWRRTLGRRRNAYRRLRHLGTGAHLTYFESVLDGRPTIKRTIETEQPDYDAEPEEDSDGNETYPVIAKEYIECFFVRSDYYVQAVADPDETVHAYSVTTRNRRFKPRFRGQPAFGWRESRKITKRIGEKWLPFVDVRLGRTTFADSSPRQERPGRISPVWGAHDYWYSETFSYGNPSYYQAFVLTASNASGDFPVAHREMNLEIQAAADEGDHDRLGGSNREALERFRKKTVVTTYTVIGPGIPELHFPTTYGPNWNDVRTIPGFDEGDFA